MGWLRSVEGFSSNWKPPKTCTTTKSHIESLIATMKEESERPLCVLSWTINFLQLETSNRHCCVFSYLGNTIHCHLLYNWCLWVLWLSLLCLYDQPLVCPWTLWLCLGSSLHSPQVEEVRHAGTRATSRRDCCECGVYHPLPFMEPQTSVAMGKPNFLINKISKYI